MLLFYLDNNVFGGSPELWANSLPINYSIESNQFKSLHLDWKHSWKETFVTFCLAMSSGAVRRCLLESTKRSTEWHQADDIRASLDQPVGTKPRSGFQPQLAFTCRTHKMSLKEPEDQTRVIPSLLKMPSAMEHWQSFHEDKRQDHIFRDDQFPSLLLTTDHTSCLLPVSQYKWDEWPKAWVSDFQVVILKSWFC